MNAEGFWEDLKRISDKLEEDFKAKSDVQLSTPMIYVVPDRKH